MTRETRRILILYPTHPAFLGMYLFIGLLISLLLVRMPFVIASSSTAPGALPLAVLAILLIDFSPLLSFMNIVITTLKTGSLVTVAEVDYVEFFGVPVPIPRLSTKEVRTALAINVGGALVPIIVSGIFAYTMLRSPYTYGFLMATIVDLVVTTAVTYLVARPVPGVGIGVPAFVPPLVAALTSVVIVGYFNVEAATAAYVAGSLGSLLGADVLRLSRSYKELSASVLSIGGAGVFDGVFISGVLAFLLAL